MERVLSGREILKAMNGTLLELGCLAFDGVKRK